MSGSLQGTFEIESVNVTSQPPNLLVSALGPIPEEQVFIVSLAPKGQGGYQIRCVNPDTTLFFKESESGIRVLSAPYEWSEFFLREVDVNINQVYVVASDGKEYAFHAGDKEGSVLELKPSDPTDVHQRWRFVKPKFPPTNT
ncbi:hypothetical protein Clacol_009454 [Clathrus columnatus]|uniref:Ricin B lectin domain-containing protein n=1 Tax=Clathrus columnatus TaxID=1419009 RepID=A0AAV5AR60_9AGAM|nr:hypothetical protein Clacol_009454 [Clathrus columnatus]